MSRRVDGGIITLPLRALFRLGIEESLQASPALRFGREGLTANDFIGLIGGIFVLEPYIKSTGKWLHPDERPALFKLGHGIKQKERWRCLVEPLVVEAETTGGRSIFWDCHVSLHGHSFQIAGGNYSSITIGAVWERLDKDQELGMRTFEKDNEERLPRNAFRNHRT